MYNIDFLKKYGCDVIYAIYKTGSNGLVSNPKDEDYLVIVDEVPHGFSRVHIRYGNADYFIWSKEQVLEIYNRNNSEYVSRDYMYLTYTLQPFNLIYGNNVVDKTILDIKDDWLKIVSEIYLDVFRSFNGKHLWYVKIPLMMIKNNSVSLTQEMYDYCQKSHDYLQTPDDYLALHEEIKQTAL